MLRKFASALSAAFLLVAFMPAFATELISGGDFDSTTLSGPDNYWVASNLNKWLMNAYSLRSTGPSGSATDLFAQHSTSGGGTDIRIVQFIDASSLSAGQSLELEFDYIYAEAGGFDPLARVSIIGISADRIYSMFGGSGVDGLWNGNGDFAVAAPDALIAQLELAYSSTWSLDNTLVATLAGEWDYIGVVFTAGCWGSSATCNTLRGIDNISLTQLPEPGTLALLGLGLAALAAARRRMH